MRFGVVGAGRVDRGALADGLGHLSCRTGFSEIGNRKALAGRVVREQRALPDRIYIYIPVGCARVLTDSVEWKALETATPTTLEALEEKCPFACMSVSTCDKGMCG